MVNLACNQQRASKERKSIQKRFFIAREINAQRLLIKKLYRAIENTKSLLRICGRQCDQVHQRAAN